MEKIDAFNKPYEFKLNYKKSGGTVFGGIATITLFSLFFFYFIALIQ